MVFAHNTQEQLQAQMIALSGDAATGFAGTATIGIKV